MSRPAGLPDFRKPPLIEVVVGVQFDVPRGYESFRAYQVWQLFSANFPEIQELPPLQPTFETFGLPVGPPFGFAVGPLASRLWFLSPARDELIQFQSDRLLHNWRKVGDHEYPRFERIASKFADELEKLERFFAGLHPQALLVRQCEVSYVNHIWVPGPNTLRVADWLSFISFPAPEPDDFTATFRRTILSPSGQPQGRLICEGATALDPDGKRFVSLTLTARGAPTSPDKERALEFLARGHQIICETFVEVTTDSAQKEWERIQ
ncbi:MAG: TIGR04255 family protein [Methylobacteriaceae bacterium]|nr:TIGR04255 family protein [Methylobacteriaceae bacterium]MBV9244539.1 TIGR04255 family protein [Methylobacteriaceae bacterium]